jgi:membrane protease subunit HflK
MAWNQPDSGQKPDPRSRRPASANGFDAWLNRISGFLSGSGRPTNGEGKGVQSRIPWIIGGILLLAWMWTGYYEVDAAERGVIQRFGRFDRVTDTGSGWGMHIPWPVETVTMINVSNVNSIDYQSRMLTSDVNLVNITCAIQFQNADPLKLLFKVRDPDVTLQQVSESAIREVIGQNTLEAVLAGASRAAITSNTRDLIQKTLDSYGTGIRVISVNLTEVQVPEAVQAAQRDANKAIEDRERYSKEAQAYSNDLLPRARGTAQRQLLEAEAYKLQAIAKAEGDTSRFSQLAAAYAQAPDVTRNRLYIETMETVLSRSRKVILDAKSGTGNMIYLPLDKMVEAGNSRTSSASSDIVVSPANGAAANTVSDPQDNRSRDRVER